jgi:hypothetical protein
LERVNNETSVWDPNLRAWVIPEVSADPSIHTDLTYDGHSHAPGPVPQSGDGDHLLGMYNRAGSLVIDFDQGINSAGLLVSIQDSDFNTNFDATIKANGRNGLATTGRSSALKRPVI